MTSTTAPGYENEFHKQAATRLVVLAKVRSGAQFLDIATGTGLAAIVEDALRLDRVPENISRLFYTRNAIATMSKLLNYICIFIITCWLLFACHFSQPLKVKRPPLKVSFVPFVGYTPLIIAQEKGFFKMQGVDVELSYLDYSQFQDADFSAGKYDGIGLTLGDLVILSATNPDMQAVMVLDESPTGADVVVAQSEIKNNP